MSRNVSLTLRNAMYAEQTGEVLVILLTITHADLDEPLRFCSDPTLRFSTDPLIYGVTSRGNNFYFMPFSTKLPDDQEETPPESQITLDNFDPRIVAMLRSTTTPAQVMLEVVLASNPDEVEVEFPELDLVSADYDANQITLSLAIEALLTEPYPSGTFEPANFSGLF